ncbi:MAG: M48 family metalloprotease [Candidatus Moranbacteria bacterium]|nr:M48 family metalloprotease [Candidatus Moranbacteria bacterium]
MNSISAQIRENNIKVYLFMTALTVVIGVLGSLLSSFVGWGMTGTSGFIILSGIINFIAYFFSDKIILRSSGARPVNREQVPELYEIIEKLCVRNDLPFPKVYLMDERTMNAFATGRNYEHSAVAVTKGLLEKLTKDEVEGVVAHELAHIKNYDMRIMAVVSILVGFISLIADIYWTSSVAGKVQEKDSSGLMAWIGMSLAVFAPLTAFFIQLAISRKREYVADSAGALMSGNPKALASALRKISLDMKFPKHLSSATAHLYFSSPGRGETVIDRLFSTHPPIEERIELLEGIN